MQTTRAFKSGDGQAVVIPDEIAFEYGQDLTITRHGDMVMIQPKRDGLKAALERLLEMPVPPTVELIERTEVPDRERY